MKWSDYKIIILEQEIVDLKKRVFELEQSLSRGGESTSKYRLSKKGKSASLYRGMKRNSKKRGHLPPFFTLEEFREWLFEQSLFHTLYEGWVRSGYNKWLAPSCDRIFESIGYTFDNIELMTWRENCDKNDRRYGALRRKVRIRQLKLNGDFIKEHISINSAAKELNIVQPSISMVLSGKLKTAGGFKFERI